MLHDYQFKLSPTDGVVVLDNEALTNGRHRTDRVVDYVMTCQSTASASYEVLGPIGWAPLPGHVGPVAPLEIVVVNGAYERIRITTTGTVGVRATSKALGLAN